MREQAPASAADADVAGGGADAARLRLSDGETVTLRKVRASDEAALIRMFSQLDPEEIRLRFFRYIRHFTHAMAVQIMQASNDRAVSIVAETAAGDIAGLATLALDPQGSEAEFGVVIDHRHHRRGLGRALMAQLLRGAAQHGVTRVRGDVMIDNEAMLALAQSLGFRRLPHPEDLGCFRIAADIRPAAQPVGVKA